MVRPEVAGTLKPEETLAIGYGSSYVDPISFVIPRGQEKDLTYFKVILTTSPADFSTLLQINNPLSHPQAGRASMTRSSTARSKLRSAEGPVGRFEAEQLARELQREKREDAYFYSMNFVVYQTTK